jgi:hypothetical protein
MNEASQVIERLFKVFNARNNNELATMLGVAYNTISTWRNRNSIPYQVCVDVATSKMVSLDWLLLGRGPMYWQEYSFLSNSANNVIQDDGHPSYLADKELLRGPLFMNMEMFLNEFYGLKGRIEKLENRLELITRT